MGVVLSVRFRVGLADCRISRLRKLSPPPFLATGLARRVFHGPCGRMPIGRTMLLSDYLVWGAVRIPTTNISCVSLFDLGLTKPPLAERALRVDCVPRGLSMYRRQRQLRQNPAPRHISQARDRICFCNPLPSYCPLAPPANVDETWHTMPPCASLIVLILLCYLAYCRARDYAISPKSYPPLPKL